MATPDWQLLQVPLVAPISTTLAGGTLKETRSPITAMFGRGIVRPFRRDRKSDWAHAEDLSLLASAIGQILGTQSDGGLANNPLSGELPWRTEFGSLVNLLRHSNNSEALEELAKAYVVDALKRWEPRIRVRGVKTERVRTSSELDTLVAHVYWVPVLQSSLNNTVQSTEVIL